ncbi:MAG: ribosome biogenesis GTPase Der [Caldilineales bacterium]|nr:ribosome biogenesis GTPase Der [Caldilineales bacterium]
MSKHTHQPVVAIVGRPNVGKSTLFNRIIGRRQAIVEDLPGTTRDRLYADTEWNGVGFLLVDTGGLEPLARGGRAPEEPLASASAGYLREIRAQVEQAIAEADVIVFLVDAAEGLTAADQEIANGLRQAGKPVIVAANKADTARRQYDAVEFYALGLGEPLPISAYHGIGIGDLLDAVVAHLPPAPPIEWPEEALRVAIVGRPNVGKSSLLNALLGQERAIVSPLPGTTRDPIDTYLTWEGMPVVLVDTAGIRRRGAIEPGIEKYSVIRTLKAIARADVVLLVLDATTGITDQDAHVAGYVLEAYRSLVLVVNKWDAIPKDEHTMNNYLRQLRSELKFLDYVPVLFVSALTRQRIDRILSTAFLVAQGRQQRLPTAELNRLVQEAVAANPPKAVRGRQARFYYATQVDIDPPTFVLFVNDPEAVHFSYLRYLENCIRQAYPFEGTPLRFELRGKKDARREDDGR